MAGNILCLDLGGSKLAWGMMTSEGNLLWHRARPWQPRDAGQVLEALLAAAREALATPQGQETRALGLTIPGPCDHVTGTWLAANFAGIRDFPITQLLQDALGLPAWADNDANACALAEQRLGAGQGAEDFVYLTVSNGIGGALVSGGRLLRGAGGLTGESGHVTIVPNGRACGCGKQGCLEAYAAGPGLSLTYRELSGRQADGKSLVTLAQRGDPLALKAWHMQGQYLALGIAQAVNLLNPERVILGGGLSLAFDQYQTSLDSALRRHVFPHMEPFPRVMPTPLGYQGGLYGAGTVALTH